MSRVSAWLVGAVLLSATAGAACWSASPAPAPVGPPPAAAAADEPRMTEFATGAGKAEPAGVKFDADRAMRYLKQLCDIGPRVSDTDGMRKQQELIEKHFKDLGATVTRQEFKAKQWSRKDPVPMTNLVVTWHPAKERRILLCSHYDTRPLADEEKDPRSWTRPFVSANDGASGVALLMELGHHMKDLKTEFGVDFVLFDGEEFVFDTHNSSPTGTGRDRYFLGSDHFADEYAKAKGARKYRYEAGVLFDLCAAAGARLAIEGYSWQFARPLVEQIWGTAKAVGAKSFVAEKGFKRSDDVQDDHLALNRVGIPAVDIIDFDYPHWHKLSDTPDKVSGAQMAEVSTVVTVWLQKIK
ncbi:MAG: hypothetical protein C0501_15865 [Isosphaera sp.]|nr:hypothetical protein [Isosphaera sp.]